MKVEQTGDACTSLVHRKGIPLLFQELLVVSS